MTTTPAPPAPPGPSGPDELGGRYSCDLGSGTWSWDDELRALVGVELSDTAGLLDAVHPDDRDHFGMVLERAKSGARPYSCEHRIRRPDGTIRLVMTSGEVRPGPAGSLMLYGSVLDITDRQRLEESLGRALAGHETVDDQAGVEQLRRYAIPLRLPRAPGVQLGARYLSATRGGRVCGDFYDARLLDQETVMLLIGDVAGHGFAAAATMSRLAALFRTFAGPGIQPAHLLRQVNAVLPDASPGALATAACATLHLPTGQLRWASAGHPPPVLVGAAGARLLAEPRNLMLGVNPEAPYADETLQLPADSMFLFYTDGLVERHDQTIEAGNALLLDTCRETYRDGPDRCCDVLLHTLGAGDREDDLCLVAMSRD